MALEQYRKKRKFTKTPEPGGRTKYKAPGARAPRFVVQEHRASHLHWDFRLELPERISGGAIVLKSWAVPKGVPEKAGIKRLATQTEDHPVEYINFEGEIPKGQYGAGTVKIWDRGTFELLERKSKAIKVKLSGKKLKGTYVLYNFKDKDWFLFKTKE